MITLSKWFLKKSFPQTIASDDINWWHFLIWAHGLTGLCLLLSCQIGYVVIVAVFKSLWQHKMLAMEKWPFTPSWVVISYQLYKYVCVKVKQLSCPFIKTVPYKSCLLTKCINIAAKSSGRSRTNAMDLAAQEMIADWVGICECKNSFSPVPGPLLSSECCRCWRMEKYKWRGAPVTE